MKYWKRFRPSGEPFYVNESGDVVDEATAKTNLQESSRAREINILEHVSLSGEYLPAAKVYRADRGDTHERMEEAIERHTRSAYQRLGLPIDEPERRSPISSAMEAAFQRVSSLEWRP